MTDIVCINLPKFEANVIPSALAILKGIANKHGLKTKIIDFNLDWVDYCDNNNIHRHNSLSNIHYIHGPHEQVKNHVDNVIKDWVRRIIQESPRVLAISIFSYYGQYFAKEIARLVKEKSPEIYIILGGPGVSSALHEKPLFGQYMVDYKFTDDFIQGTAESSWTKIINKVFNLKLVSLNDTFLDSNYINDYSDFEFDRYRKNSKRPGYWYMKDNIVITYSTSEGCVRKCDFCEIHRYWGFRQRTSEQIKKNLQPLIELVNDCHIEFTDSLLNGSLTEFNEILDVLINFKKQYPNFTWSGQYIIRNHKTYPEEFYEKILRAGGLTLYVGIETGSEELRFKMNKPFTNLDLDHTLEMFKKYGLTCTFLLFVGHPEETLKDFQCTIDMFTKYQHYAGNVIRFVQLNSVMCVHKNTPLYDKAIKLGLKLTADPGLWSCKSNPTLTFKERMRRRFLLGEHLKNLNYNMAHDTFVTLDEYALTYSKYKHAIGIVDRN